MELFIAFCLTFCSANYFSECREPTGAIQDRSSKNDVFSVAASGFSLLIYAHDKPQKEALELINQTLDYYKKINPDKNRGWLYHFHNQFGDPIFNKEVSSVDTGIFYACATEAAKHLNDADLIKKVARLVSEIDFQWMIANSPSRTRFSHGLIWKNDQAEFIPHEWDEYNEGIILYRLFKRPFLPTKIRYDLSLFAFYYPKAIYPADQEINTHLQNAIKFHLKNYGHLVTAVDTENGYQNLPLLHTNPLISYALGVSDRKSTVHSLNTVTGWKSNDRIGIDEGAAYLLLNQDK